MFASGCFGWLSPAAVHSADCQFDSGVKWWIHVSTIVTYLCKNSFLLCWKKTLWIVNVLLFLINCEQTQHPLWTKLSYWQMFMQNGKYTVSWYLQLLCYLMQLQFTIGQNEFVEFFVFSRTTAEFRRPEHCFLMGKNTVQAKKWYKLFGLCSIGNNS